MDAHDPGLVDPTTHAALAGVGAAFAPLAGAFLALDAEFRVVFASPLLDRLLGAGTAQQAAGRPIEQLAGSALFGLDGSLRRALAIGQRAHEPRTWLPSQSAHTEPLSITATPLTLPPEADRDRRIAYMVLVHPADADLATMAAPTPGAHGSVSQEAERLRHALDAHRWSRRDTARALGISRTTLWRLMRDHGLQGAPGDEAEH